MNRPMSTVRRLAGAVAVTAGLGAALVGAASPAAADDVEYVHPTNTNAGCHVYSNYPKENVNDYGWDVGPGAELDVRFTFSGYALVKDPARSGAGNPLHYGYVAQSCLNDPHAYNDGYTQQLGDEQGVGGNGQVKTVDVAPAPGAEADLIHVTSGGTLRSDPGSFPIGNVHDGDSFYITTATCGTHNSYDWIYGRDTNSGRWGWVEALHFSACV